jgi:hypothetical protein
MPWLWWFHDTFPSTYARKTLLLFYARLAATRSALCLIYVTSIVTPPRGVNMLYTHHAHSLWSWCVPNVTMEALATRDRTRR